jgi:hypothetical protein
MLNAEKAPRRRAEVAPVRYFESALAKVPGAAESAA